MSIESDSTEPRVRRRSIADRAGNIPPEGESAAAEAAHPSDVQPAEAAPPAREKPKASARDIAGILGTSTAETGAFRIGATGTIDAVKKPSVIDRATTVHAKMSLPAELAETKHLLALAADVEPEEVEALAFSIWDEAGWVSPGILRLNSAASLAGPWPVSPELRASWQLPKVVTQVFVVDCPVLRGEPTPPELHGLSPLMDAFPAGAPEGTELEVLTGLLRISRRLAGGLRVAPSGILVEPDPDSAVTLTVYAPRWISPADLTAALGEPLPGAQEYRAEGEERSPEEIAQAHQQAWEAAAELGLAEAEIEWIQAEADAYDDHAHLAKVEIRDSFGLMAPAGNTSQVQVAVYPAHILPDVLRWETWDPRSVVAYQVSWQPAVPELAFGNRIRRAVRLERMRVTRVIEATAGALAAFTGGQIVDEDGFLVRVS